MTIKKSNNENNFRNHFTSVSLRAVRLHVDSRPSLNRH